MWRFRARPPGFGQASQYGEPLRHQATYVFPLGLRPGWTINAAMPLFNLPEFFSSLAPGARLIGLDPGARRIGIALSDVSRRIASPYETIHRGKLAHNAGEIKAIAEEEGVGGLIIGLPLGEDGKFGPAAQAARDWAHAIS